MKKNGMKGSIEVPEGIEININNDIVKAKGIKGEVSKKFNISRVKIKKENNKINFSVDGDSRKDKDILNANLANFNNMLKGVKEPYIYRLKVCSGHFPMNVAIDKNKVVIKNFLGEKLPRVAKILDGVSVKLNGDVIVVESSDKDKAGQVSANIEIATKIIRKDRRVFQDGIFLIEKAGELVK